MVEKGSSLQSSVNIIPQAHQGRQSVRRRAMLLLYTYGSGQAEKGVRKLIGTMFGLATRIARGHSGLGAWRAHQP